MPCHRRYLLEHKPSATALSNRVGASLSPTRRNTSGGVGKSAIEYEDHFQNRRLCF